MMKRCCLNCQGFALWDGDYCCVTNMKIHQYGYSNGIWMNEDIDNTMETPETCKDYQYANKNPYYIEEYKKFKEYQKMQKEYYKFVN